MENRYVSNFVNNTLRGFRRINNDSIEIVIDGLFYSNNKSNVDRMIKVFSPYDVKIIVNEEVDKTGIINVKYRLNDSCSNEKFNIQIYGLSYMIYLASKTQLSIPELLILKIIGQVLNRIKTLYKVIVLDLDDTLWNGTLSEIGKEGIKQNLNSKEGRQFVSFMRFIKSIGEELGVFIAINSRNKLEDFQDTISFLDEIEFPLINQIDVIAINENDKSNNIINIASMLSVLPNSIVFIDDNVIVRNEVRQNLPEVYVPDWETHEDLIIQLEISSVFERPFISKASQQRRKQYKIIQAEKENNYLPVLSCNWRFDIDHKESKVLYGKSNQFNFSQINRDFDNEYKSLIFCLLSSTGDDLGICSTLTFKESEDNLTIYNWAISCRFFEIGLEETILNFISNLASGRNLYIIYKDSGHNARVQALLNNYPEIFIMNKDKLKIKLPMPEYLKEKTNIVIE